MLPRKEPVGPAGAAGQPPAGEVPLRSRPLAALAGLLRWPALERGVERLRGLLDRFIHQPYIEALLVVLILASVSMVVLEVWMDRTGRDYGPVHAASDTITFVFVAELTLRFFIARSKRRFFRNYWIDILSVLPLTTEFRALRVLRLLRLLRVGVLLNRRLSSVSVTLAASVGAQLGVFLMVGVVILVGSLTMFLVEGGMNEGFDTLGEAMWWAAFTLVAGEPIGGEARTDTGRFVTMLIVLGGLTMFAVFTGVVSAVMVQRLRTGMEVRDVGMEDLRGHVVICGWSRGVPLIIEELQSHPATREQPIVVVAEFAEPPELQRVPDRRKIFFLTGDYTSIDVLEQVGIPHAAQAILIADRSLPRSDQDRDARTVLAALTIEKLNPSIFTCAQLLDRKNNVHLRVAGVEEVVIGDEVSSHLIASSARNRGLTDIFGELLTVREGNEFYKVPVPEAWVGTSFGLSSQRLKERSDAILIALERWADGRRISMVNPPSGELLERGDSMVLISRGQPRLL
jgi:voltage-gated potassium channel